MATQAHPRRLRVLYFEAGSGHMTAARGLARALSPVLGDGWEVAPLDLVELFEPGSPRDTSMRKGIDDFNAQLQRERVFDLRGRINLGRLFNSSLLRRGLPEMIQRWHAIGAPDAVVSVTPMYNSAVAASLRCVKPHARYVTIPVDFEECKRRYWFDTRAPQDYLVSSDALLSRARARGIPEARLRKLGGMVVAPSFYEPPPVTGPQWYTSQGLDPDLPLVVAHFGAQGSKILVDIVRAIDQCDTPFQVAALCGRHDETRRRVAALSTRHPVRAYAFTERPPSDFYHHARALIGKPGAMTITEALIARAPMLAIASTGMATVQRGNERWVERAGIGRVVKNPRALPQHLDHALSELGAREYDAAIARARHRGVFDATADIAELVAP